MARVVNQTKDTLVARQRGHARTFLMLFRGLTPQSSLDGMTPWLPLNN